MCAPEAVLPIQTDDVSTSVGIVALLVRLMRGAASLSDRSGWSRSASPRSFSTGARPLHGPQDRKDSEHIRPALARGAAPDQLLGRHRDRRGRAGQYTRRSRIQYQAQQAAWSRFARALPPDPGRSLLWRPLPPGRAGLSLDEPRGRAPGDSPGPSVREPATDG